jgi:pimeloyl-ACP methyl ester carboxylesterase
MPKTSNGLYYEVRGDGPETIVLLPGFGCSIACYDEFTPFLEGYRSVMFDLPGHANSVGSRDDGVLAHMAEDVFSACQEIGLTSFAIAGLSLGGAISVRVGLDHPEAVRAVIGIMPWNAGGTQAGEDANMKAFHDAFRDNETIKAGIEGMSHKPEKTTDLLDTMPTVPEQMWKGWLGGGAYTSMADELPGMKVPTMYVVGGDDFVVDLHKQVDDIRKIPGGRLVMLTDEGHLAIYEEPERVAKEVVDYLRSQQTVGV